MPNAATATKPEGPTDLKKERWWHTAKRAFKEFREDQMMDSAAALTYYAVLSIFPAITILVSLMALFGQHPQTTNALLDVVGQVAPQSTVDMLQPAVSSVIQSGGVLALAVAVAAALWTASGYVGAFFRASNRIYEVPEGRGFFKLRPLQMLLTLVLLIGVGFGAVVFVVTGGVAQAVGSVIGVGDAAVTAWQIAKWPVLALVAMLLLALLFYTAPNVEQPKFRWLTPGGAAALVVWVIVSAAFAFYVANFGSYDKTYGTLAGVVVFLLWLWVTNLALLFGAEFDAELQRSRKIAAGMRPADKEPFLPLRSEPDADDEDAGDLAREEQREHGN